MNSYTIKIPLYSEKRADILAKALGTDETLSPETTSKSFVQKGTFLYFTFRAKNIKLLRTCVSGNLETIALAIKSIEAFE